MSSVNTNRIAKNTLFLYLRLFLTMLINLYTSRIVLNALGVEQFGIYNVVGGVVAFFSFLQGSLTASTQRFLNFEMGKPKYKQDIAKVFSTSLLIHYAIAVICLLLVEPIGFWFVSEKLNIASNYLSDTIWVFHFSVLTLLITLVSIPYNALIIAYEKMSIFAYISIVEVLLKLLVAFSLTWVSSGRLVLYAGLLVLVSIVVRMIYGIYCYRSFPQCRLKYIWDVSLIKKMFSFSGWMFSSTLTSLLSTQGVNILLNIFFGTIVNAARGIAYQVQSAVGSFAVNFMMAVNPQIVKSYSEGNTSYMNQLVCSSSKYSFYLMLLIVIPLILEMEHVLCFWLGNVPDFTVCFARLVLIDILFQSLFSPIAVAIQATGRLKKYQLAISVCFSMLFLLTYLVFKLGFPAYTTFVLSIIISIIGIYIRLRVLIKEVAFPIHEYIYNVIFPILKAVAGVIAVAACYTYAVSFMQISNWILLNVFILLMVLLAIIWFLGTNAVEKNFVKNKIRSYGNKFFR